MPAPDVALHARPRLSARRRLLRPGALVAASALVVAGLAACGSSPEDTSQQDAEKVASALAAGLASGDLSGVVFTGSTPEAVATEREEILAPLGDVQPTVSVLTVQLDEERTAGTATLDYTWDVAGVPWTYSTDAPLTLVEDTWQTQWSPDVLVDGLAAGDTLQLTRTAAQRADVLGADDAVLVTDRPVRKVGIDKTRVEEASLDSAARSLAELTAIDPDAYAAKVVGAGPKAFVEAVTLRVEGDYDWDAIAASPGTLLVDATLPLAPTRGFASALLGRAGPATAEIVEASDGAVVDGDVAGLSGLQRQYDAQLRGTPGIALQAVSESGTARDLVREDAVPGEPLRTTIDPRLQQLAEQTLAGQAVPASIVAIRPSTGQVLVSANSPGSEGMATSTAGLYAPGSTFKVVTALALLRSGLTVDSVLRCTDEAVVDGRAFKNFPDYPADRTGDISLRDVIASSCNTALINEAGQVSQADLVSAGQALGFGLAQQPGPAFFTGKVPADSTGTAHAASMIGQGTVQASPLAMATVAASVAAGTTVRPTFLAQDADPVESDLPDAAPSPLTAEEGEQLAALMRAVVTDGGAQFLLDVPGEPVGAKTGTAQYGDGSTNHAWMIAVQGDLAVAVFVETGDYGSTTAGPLLAELLREIA